MTAWHSICFWNNKWLKENGLTKLFPRQMLWNEQPKYSLHCINLT